MQATKEAYKSAFQKWTRAEYVHERIIKVTDVYTQSNELARRWVTPKHNKSPLHS